MTADLIEWLRAQLGREERAHRSADEYRRANGLPPLPPLAGQLRDQRRRDAYQRIIAVVTGWNHHECDDSYYDCEALYGKGCTCGLDARRRAVLAPIAAIYADRPGYNPAWAPEEER